MKATTKYQKHIVKVMKKLKPLTSAKKKWLIDKSFWFYAMKHYSSLVCCECAHKWKDSFGKRKHVKCPGCGKKLKEVTYHNSGYTSMDSHGVFFDRVGDIAVIRIVYIKKHLKKGSKAEYSFQEVVRKVFDPTTGKYTLFQCTLNGMMGSYQGGWSFGSELALKGHPNIENYKIQVDSRTIIHPSKRIPKHFLRAGFHFGEDDMLNSYDKLMYVLIDSRMETIYKYKEKGLLNHFMRYQKLTDKHWSAIKIAFRKHYLIEPDGFRLHDWLDLVNLLIHFKKDVTNPHYVCPENFHEMHNLFVKRKRKWDKENQKRLEKLSVEKRKQDLINQEKKAKEDAIKYIARRKKYFTLIFKEKDITIEVMKSVEQFMEEGDLLGHCLYASTYYNKEHSLIMSARVKGKVIETIEINLDDMQLIQNRGEKNLPTEYSNRIKKLVNKNLSKIEKVHKTKAA